MKLLVLGHRGQLGWELMRQAVLSGVDIQGADLPELNITDGASLRDGVEASGAHVVINTAAYTAVDRAEEEPAAAFAVNRDAVAMLAEICAGYSLPCIHISTDYVFDGTASRPYREEDPIAPLGVYGQSKAQGEESLRRRLDRHVIIRTAWLYGVHGHNFVKTMLRLGGEHETLRVVADQQGCPTFAADLAAAILRICKSVAAAEPQTWGTYHYCGQGVATWHEFAQEIFRLARPHQRLTVESVAAIRSDEYPAATRRPAYSVLDCRRIGSRFGIQIPPWRLSLATMIERHYTESADNFPVGKE
jgi:dTDP-4-dehydrorhamnose reductase